MTATFDREYRTTDKAEWGVGPWQAEPDKVQWVDSASGLDCLIVRGPSGALCGYVGLPPEHPWHGRSYNECLTKCDEDFCYEHSPEAGVRVHGGLTFSDACRTNGDESKGICHVPLPGRPHDVWWFGFDCAHSGDLSPMYREYGIRFGNEEYRDIAYVQSECSQLAQQLAEVTA